MSASSWRPMRSVWAEAAVLARVARSAKDRWRIIDVLLFLNGAGPGRRLPPRRAPGAGPGRRSARRRWRRGRGRPRRPDLAPEMAGRAAALASWLECGPVVTAALP